MEGIPIRAAQHRRGCAIAGSRTYFEDASLRRHASGSIYAGQRRDSARCIIGSRGGGAGSPGKLTRPANCPPVRVVKVIERTGGMAPEVSASRKLGTSRLASTNPLRLAQAAQIR